MGSSSRNRSNRLRRVAASSARAAWPPDSVVIGRSRSGGGQAEVGPRGTDAGVEVGAAEGQPPLEGGGVAVVGARRRPRPTAALAASSSAVAAATPVRRARKAADRLAGAALGLLGQEADGGVGRGQRDRAPLGPLDRRRARAAASTCPRRSGRRRRCGGPGATVRSTSVRMGRRPWVTVMLARQQGGEAGGHGSEPPGAETGRDGSAALTPRRLTLRPRYRSADEHRRGGRRIAGVVAGTGDDGPPGRGVRRSHRRAPRPRPWRGSAAPPTAAAPPAAVGDVRRARGSGPRRGRATSSTTAACRGRSACASAARPKCCSTSSRRPPSS